jgi:hypothetical protein
VVADRLAYAVVEVVDARGLAVAGSPWFAGPPVALAVGAAVACDSVAGGAVDDGERVGAAGRGICSRMAGGLTLPRQASRAEVVRKFCCYAGDGAGVRHQSPVGRAEHLLRLARAWAEEPAHDLDDVRWLRQGRRGAVELAADVLVVLAQVGQVSPVEVAELLQSYGVATDRGSTRASALPFVEGRWRPAGRG